MTPEIEKLTGGPLGVNTYILSAPWRDECVVVDPGVPLAQIEEGLAGRRVAAVLLTHAHFDHMLTLSPLREAGAPLYLHRLDAPMLSNERLNLCAAIDRHLTAAPAEHLLEDGDVVEAAGLTLRALHTPGHTPGGLCLLVGDDLLSGDTMFCGGYGRTDFPGGSARDLYASLRRLCALDGRIRVHPGHGMDTTIAEEREARA